MVIVAYATLALIVLSCSGAEFRTPGKNSGQKERKPDILVVNEGDLNGRPGAESGGSFQPGGGDTIQKDTDFGGGDGSGTTTNPELFGGMGTGECGKPATIDFEDQTTAGIPMNTQYKKSHGVTFSMSDGQTILQTAKIGVDPQFHQCLGNDTGPCGSEINGIRPNSRAITGSTFIGTILSQPVYLIIDYVQPVKAASGYIIDADAGEYFQIFAFNKAGDVVASDASVDSRGKKEYWKDGEAMPFRLQAASKSIVRIIVRGQRANGLAHLSFDRFSPADICN